jgi:hypothetical protein
VSHSELRGFSRIFDDPGPTTSATVIVFERSLGHPGPQKAVFIESAGEPDRHHLDLWNGEDRDRQQGREEERCIDGRPIICANAEREGDASSATRRLDFARRETGAIPIGTTHAGGE